MRRSIDTCGRRKTQHEYIKDVQKSDAVALEMLELLNQLNATQRIHAVAVVQASQIIYLNRLDRRGEL